MTANPPKDRVLGLSARSLDALMPLHIWVGAAGQVLRCGPTLKRILPDPPPLGAPFRDLFTVRRPRAAYDLQSLLMLSGGRVRLELAALPGAPFKATVVALPAGVGALLNLSFGYLLRDAVQRYDLTLSDFAPTDLAVELLYLAEANDAAREELASFARRLDDSRAEAETRADTDQLTGLANRRVMDRMLGRLTHPANTSPFSIMHVDLDLFKEVNDTLGHAAGDTVLREVAKILGRAIRADDLVARIGGDEFVLILRGNHTKTSLDEIARRIIDDLQRPVQFQDTYCHISASIGTTQSCQYDRLDPDRLLSDADVALYASKRAGRACHTVYSPSLRH